MEMSGHHHAVAALPRDESHYPLVRRLSGPQSQSGRFGEEESLLPLLTFEPRIFQPLA